MNFRLLSDTPIAPAGRRQSGADIFAPPGEVCGTNFPLPLSHLWGSVSGGALGVAVIAFLNCFRSFFYHCFFCSVLFDFFGVFSSGNAQDPPQRTAPRLYRGGGVKSVIVSAEPYYQAERSHMLYLSKL